METKFNPNYAIHPGELLQDEIEALGLTQKEVAEIAGVSKTIINEIIKGKRNINAEIAVRLEDVLESPAKFWLKAQMLYDETVARIKLNKEGLSDLVENEEDFSVLDKEMLNVNPINIIIDYGYGKGMDYALEAA